MIVMRKILFVLLSLLATTSLNAQRSMKLVERSAKNKPDWIINNSDYSKGYLFVQANKVASLEDAKDIVMSSLLSEIASSVAVVITGEIESTTSWETVELNGVTKDEFIQSVKDNTTTKIAKMPALQGISLIKAESYWERYINKKTKETFYDYYILYPFSQFELQELIDAYNEQEAALNLRIDNYRNVLPEIDNVDVILESITEMKVMMKEIGESDMKYNKLKGICALYERLLKDIYVEVIENYNESDEGILIIQLKHDEKIMKTKSLPQLRGTCARDFNRKHVGNQIKLTFNTFDCYEQDDNYVEVRFTFGKVKLIKKININL